MTGAHDTQFQGGSLSYLPQLDAIRAFAVLLVMWHHWVGPPELPLGPTGVWIFFVLSGFLITRILLRSRSEAPLHRRRALLNFYARRFLRIFPLYYLVLLAGFAASATLRADWPWYVSYLQNLMMMRVEDDRHVFGVHLWTLAVEEQFYIAWPLFVLFLPRSALLPVIWSGIAAAVALRCLCVAMGWTPFQAYAFTPCNLDTLGLGALLAHSVTHRPGQIVRLRRIALVAAVVLLVGTPLLRSPALSVGLMALPTGLIAFWFISNVAEGTHGFLWRALRFPPSVYLGRISYGLYIYHYFVPDIVRPLLQRWHIEEHGVMPVVIWSLATMSIASLSWFLFERPINALKNRFCLPTHPCGQRDREAPLSRSTDLHQVGALQRD